MKIRKLLSLLLAAILCFTIALSLFACEDDPAADDETTGAEDVVDDGGEDVVDDGGEDVVDEGEEAAE